MCVCECVLKHFQKNFLNAILLTYWTLCAVEINIQILALYLFLTDNFSQ